MLSTMLRTMHCSAARLYVHVNNALCGRNYVNVCSASSKHSTMSHTVCLHGCTVTLSGAVNGWNGSVEFVRAWDLCPTRRSVSQRLQRSQRTYSVFLWVRGSKDVQRTQIGIRPTRDPPARRRPTECPAAVPPSTAQTHRRLRPAHTNVRHLPQTVHARGPPHRSESRGSRMAR
jgi:hypothetical protein